MNHDATWRPNRCRGLPVQWVSKYRPVGQFAVPAQARNSGTCQPQTRARSNWSDRGIPVRPISKTSTPPCGPCLNSSVVRRAYRAVSWPLSAISRSPAITYPMVSGHKTPMRATSSPVSFQVCYLPVSRPHIDTAFSQDNAAGIAGLDHRLGQRHGDQTDEVSQVTRQSSHIVSCRVPWLRCGLLSRREVPSQS